MMTSMRRINPNEMFTVQTDEDGVRRTSIATAIYDTTEIGPGGTGTVDFGGDAVDLEVERLFDREEQFAVDWLLRTIPGWQWCCEAVRMDPTRTWAVLHLDRTRLAGISKEPLKPGDFDVVMGPSAADGTLLFEPLASLEFKLRKVDSDGAGRNFSSGVGTTQARGALELGFDRCVLAHILVRDRTSVPPLYSRSWSGLTAVAMERAMRGCAGRVAQAERDHDGGPYGYAVFAVGEIPRVDVRRTGALQFVPVREAEDRPLDLTNATTSKNRAALRRAIQAVVGQRRGSGIIDIP